MSPFIRFVRSLIAGGVTALVNVGGLWVFTEYAGFHYLASSGFAFAIALCVNFILQRVWVFGGRMHREPLHQFVRYGILVGANFFLNLAGLYLLTELFDVWYIGSQVIVTCILAVANFVLADRYIFKGG